MKNRKISAVLVLIIFVLLVGCEEESWNLSGTYTGQVGYNIDGGPRFETTMTLTLSQSGDDVSGTWSLAAGGGGLTDLSGIIRGDSRGEMNPGMDFIYIDIMAIKSPCDIGMNHDRIAVVFEDGRIAGSFEGAACAIGDLSVIYLLSK